MTGQTTVDPGRPVWVELTSSDPAGSREFYGHLFGWDIEVSADPQYGGYAMARLDGDDVAGIGPQQQPGAPSAWGVYLGTDDIGALAGAVSSAGGTVVAAPFDVGDQGRMAVFRDPSGAFISAWQAGRMRQFGQGRVNTYGWAELNSRDLEAAVPFYERVFGWQSRTSELGGDQPPYTEFQQDGQSVAGAWAMSPDMPAEVPSYWAVYFNVDDVDEAVGRAVDLGGTVIVSAQDMPGGRFAIVGDPQGASFGLLKMGE